MSVTETKVIHIVGAGLAGTALAWQLHFHGVRPILLLDDIFDKIDPQRMRHLLKLLGSGSFGQVIITDTDAGRLRKALDGLPLETRFFTLEHSTPVTVMGIDPHHEAQQRAVAETGA